MRLAIILALMASPAAAVDLQKFQSPTQKSASKSAAKSNAAAASLSAAQVSTIAEGGASYSGSAVNFTFNQAGGGNAGGGGGTTAIKTVPDVYAPALAGGNPCVVSVSAGAGWLGAGFSFGMGLQDEGCEVRQQAALLHNMGEASVALSHMCIHLPEVGETLKTMGRDCTE